MCLCNGIFQGVCLYFNMFHHVLRLVIQPRCPAEFNLYFFCRLIYSIEMHGHKLDTFYIDPFRGPLEDVGSIFLAKNFGAQILKPQVDRDLPQE